MTLQNRELKFREFINGKFHYWGFVEEGIFKGPVTPSLTRGHHNQYTGLKDKNGVEIYEGDILRFELPVNGADGEEGFLPLIVTISFQGAAFWFIGGGYTDCNWHFYNAEDREVIGNIYENPDLLTTSHNKD